MKKIVLLFMMGFAINSAFSQILFTEDFSYTSQGAGADTLTSPAIGGSKWTRHSGGSGVARDVSFKSSSLAYSGFSGSNVGGAAGFQNTVGSEDINAKIGTNVTSGNLYASFLLRIDSAGGSSTASTYFFHLLDSSGTNPGANFRARLFVADSIVSGTTKFKIGISKGTDATITAANLAKGQKFPQYTNSVYDLGTTYLVVLKYIYNSGSKNDDLALFVIPSGIPATEPTPDVSFSDTSISDLTKIQSVCIRQGSGGRTLGLIDGIRVFTTWDAATVALLPIKLNSFTANGLKNVVNLNWSVICAENSCNFQVERSIDGVTFNLISTNNATSKANYLFADKNLPNASTLYYRLKIVSANGKVEYSTVQKVQLKDIKLSVSPNPTSNEILVNATSNIAAVNVFDLTGKSIYSVQNNNTNSIRISVANLPEGTYVVKSTTIDGETVSNKIVVKH